MKELLDHTQQHSGSEAIAVQFDPLQTFDTVPEQGSFEAFANADWWKLIDGPARYALQSICSNPISTPAKSDLDVGKKPHDRLYLVLEGWFARYRETSRGLRQTLSISLPGEFLNPEALYLDGSTIGLSALTDGRVLAIEFSDLAAIMADHPQIAHMFSALVAKNNVLLSEETSRLGRRTARERMAHFTCEIITRLDRIAFPDSRGHRFPLTQDQIADALGLTVVHLNRTLQDLRAMGLVEWRAHRLQILDWPKLARIAAFDAAYLEPVERAARPHRKPTPRDDRLGDTHIRELQHRFKNLVSVVKSLTYQTLRDDADIGEARTTLAARFDALGKSIDILAPSGWTQGSLLEVVKQTLQLSQATEQVTFEGPNLIVDGQAISTIAMAIHELQTNALKHGALSNGSGSVKLFWKVVQSGAGPKLWMQWSEKGGPSVANKPKSGFGTRLLSSVTARTLSGETILDYDRDGLNWLLIAPLDKITPAN